MVFNALKNLQESQGSQGFGNELRFRDPDSHRLQGHAVPVKFADYAAALGATTFFATDTDELKNALILAKQATCSTLIEIKVAPQTMSDGYETWWRVGVADVSASGLVTKAHKKMAKALTGIKDY